MLSTRLGVQPAEGGQSQQHDLEQHQHAQDDRQGDFFRLRMAPKRTCPMRGRVMNFLPAMNSEPAAEMISTAITMLSGCSLLPGGR